MAGSRLRTGGAREDASVSLTLPTLQFAKMPPQSDKPGIEGLEDRCSHVPGPGLPQANLHHQGHASLQVAPNSEGRTAGQELLPLRCREFGPASRSPEPAPVPLEEHEWVRKQLDQGLAE